MKVAIVDYCAGNVQSVKNALQRLGLEPVLANQPEVLKSADKVIFPGVGEASSAMRFLNDRNLVSVLKELTQPVLGICLGMQLFCEFSEENETECMGIFPFRVRSFQAGELKVPHIGWNQIIDLKSTLFENIEEASYVYFVHGFYVEHGVATNAACDYGLKFSAAVSQNNFYGVQFHPEKSGEIGEKILRNFLEI